MAGWNYGTMLAYSNLEKETEKSPIDEIISNLTLTESEVMILNRILAIKNPLKQA